MRRRAAFQLQQKRLRRMRTFVGLSGFVPLGASLFCPDLLGPVCAIPREVFLLLWAAVFGSFLGLTLRMWRERRAFDKAEAAA